MKHQLLFTLLLLTVACSKQRNGTPNELIQGTWELRIVQGGISPPTNFPPGNGKTLTFTDQRFSVKDYGKETNTGSYTIVPGTADSSLCPNDPSALSHDRLVSTPAIMGGFQYFEIKDGFLQMFTGCPSPSNDPVTTWQRIK